MRDGDFFKKEMGNAWTGLADHHSQGNIVAMNVMAGAST
jgi:hypothetical protein